MVVAETLIKMQDWNASNGFDFIIPATHPIAPAHSIHETNNNVDILSHATFLCVDYDGSARYPKDIIVPYVTLHMSGINLRAKRTRLLMMISQPIKFVRERILSIYADFPDVYISSRQLSAKEYNVLLQTTKFCFMARGDSTSSSRLFDVINSACVPVIVSDWIFLPFQNLIDYSKFVIFARESDVISSPQSFIKQLRDVPDENIRLMRKYMKQAKFLVNYDSHYRFNPVSLIIIEAALRRICYTPFIGHEEDQQRSEFC